MFTFFLEYFYWFCAMLCVYGIALTIGTVIITRRNKIAPFEKVTGTTARKNFRTVLLILWGFTWACIIIAAFHPEIDPRSMFCMSMMIGALWIGFASTELERESLWRCVAVEKRYEIPVSAYQEIIDKDEGQEYPLYKLLNQLNGVSETKYQITADRTFIHFTIDNPYNTPKLRQKVEYMVKNYVQG